MDGVSQTITIRTPQVEFYAQIRGALPRAVFVHGLGGDLHTWDAVWDATDDLPALRYDRRGCGQSVCRQPAPFKHADDLLAVLDACHIQCCDLIGVSQGAAVALNFTLDHPERVDKLILISPGLVGWEWSQTWRKLSEPISLSAAGGAIAEARRLWWSHPLFYTTRNTPAGPALLQSIMTMSAQQWLESEHVLMPPDVERLHQLTTRTLLMTGARDLDDFRLIADLIQGSAANVERVDEPECGHLLHLENPQGCALRISEFLQIAHGLDPS